MHLKAKDHKWKKIIKFFRKIAKDANVIKTIVTRLLYGKKIIHCEKFECR
jgi:hypothetical protein